VRHQHGQMSETAWGSILQPALNSEFRIILNKTTLIFLFKNFHFIVTFLKKNRMRSRNQLNRSNMNTLIKSTGEIKRLPKVYTYNNGYVDSDSTFDTYRKLGIEHTKDSDGKNLFVIDNEIVFWQWFDYGGRQDAINYRESLLTPDDKTRYLDIIHNYKPIDENDFQRYQIQTLNKFRINL
jgi:hypothetical protein